MTRPQVTYVMPDKVGGVTTIIENLLRFKRPDGMRYQAVLTHTRHDADARYAGTLSVDRRVAFEHSLPAENIHAVARRLRAAVGGGPGVLVCNDALELMMATLVDPGQTVIQILHGDYDYYYDLATLHEPLVHAFVAYSRRVYDNLLERLPQRRETIFWLPYGVVIPEKTRVPTPAVRPVRPSSISSAMLGSRETTGTSAALIDSTVATDRPSAWLGSTNTS